MYVVPAADYEALSGRALNLGKGEIAASTRRANVSVGESLTVGNRAYRVREVLDAFEGEDADAMSVITDSRLRVSYRTH